jgi:hypothetical protein
MTAKGKPNIDQLDQYLAHRDYSTALRVLAEEIKQKPDHLNLLLRQAEIFGLAGRVDEAVAVYLNLAQHYAAQGFYARAIAVTNKVLRLDPSRTEVTKDLAQLIAAQQEVEKASQDKLRRATVTTTHSPAHDEPAPEPPATTPKPPPEPPAAEPPTVEDHPASPQDDRERAASRFFGALPQAALEQLLSSTSVRSFSPGEAVVREGEPGTSLFLIEDGAVEVLTTDTSGRRLVLATLGPGEFFGEVGLLTGRPRTATIVAVVATTVIEIAKQDLDAIAIGHPEVETVLRTFYEQRAQATVEAVIARMRAHDG